MSGSCARNPWTPNIRRRRPPSAASSILLPTPARWLTRRPSPSCADTAFANARIPQESLQNPPRHLLHPLWCRGKQPALVKDYIWTWEATAREGIPTMKSNKVSKLRVAAAGLLAAVGLSLLGSLAPAVASADPWVPFSGPLHPMRHYAADVLHPVWAITHPIRATVP
jgi:hypothetical protein